MKATTFRADSAVYVFKGKGAVLMDCGESCYGQLFDHFGSKEAVSKVIEKTRVVFISHKHGDHLYGLYKFLTERDKLNPDKPLFLVLPTPVIPSVEHYLSSSWLNHPKKIKIVNCKDLLSEDKLYY
jgi:ribonuclease Z